MTIHLIQSVRTENFRLYCTFAGNIVIEYDMSDIKKEKGPMAQPLKKPSFFSQVFIESGIPTWPNGYDVSPELIFRTGKRMGTQKQQQR